MLSNKVIGAMPACVQASFDPLFHRTVELVVSMCQFEIDLSDEGDREPPLTKNERARLVRYIAFVQQ